MNGEAEGEDAMPQWTERVDEWEKETEVELKDVSGGRQTVPGDSSISMCLYFVRCPQKMHQLAHYIFPLPLLFLFH